MNRKTFLNVLGPGLIGTFLVPNIGATHHIPPCPGNARRADEEKIVQALFRITPEEVKNQTGYHYNGYGCHEGRGIYKGGHAGWDAYHQVVNHKFYSLTSGIVIAKGGDSENTIAIYDPSVQVAVLYLHASDVDPYLKIDSCIEFGAPLGLQGNTSHRKGMGAHVHVEVRKFQIPYTIQQLAKPSHGTKHKERKTVDPIPHLLKSVELHTRPKADPQPMVWADQKKR
ncbi:MAG: hypothetical protein OXL96_27125 [Candidatus Poribacteria bacterium]|nr:hypothetical protein [Candidatus Poribacteria bacterium]